MADIFDYMRWRGDLPFERDGLNDIDNLILSRAAYLPLGGIAPHSMSETMPLGAACREFLKLPDAESRVVMAADMELARALTETPRFANLPVRGCEELTDPERELQFAAMVFSIAPERHYVAYMGTDASFVGWKEDFNMSFITPVPAQLEAERYLERAAAELPGELIPGGHSKGGNLAVYASAFASRGTQQRISAVYSNDGPGFQASVLQTDGYLAIAPKIRSFVPQSSIVGMMLEHEEDYTIVKSRQVSFWQHDLYSWEVLGREFVQLGGVTNSSRFVDRTLKTWLTELPPEQRERFVDGIFTILENTNLKGFNDLSAAKLASIKALIGSAAGLDEETRAQILYALGLLLRSARESLVEILPGRDRARIEKL